MNLTAYNLTAHALTASATKIPSPAESKMILADPQITAFVPDMETTSYIGKLLPDVYFPDGASETPQYDLILECSDPGYQWLWYYGEDASQLVSADDLGNYLFFNACIALTNLTRDIDSGVPLPADLTNNLTFYNVGGKEGDEDTTILMDGITAYAVEAMEAMCSVSRCHGVGEDANPDVCTEKTLYVDEVATTLSFDGVNDCQAQVCKKAKKMNTEDADIGGIGVFISYGIQLLIAAILFLICVLDWLFCALNKRFYIRRKNSFLQSKAFINLIINFHKAQIFFVMSVMVAAYIRMHTKSDDVSYIDRFFLLLVAINGIALLSFTMMTVYMIAGRSRYMLFTTIVGYLLCFALFLEIVLTRRKHLVPYVAVNYFCLFWSKGVESYIGESEMKVAAIGKFLEIMVSLPGSALFTLLTFTTLVMLFLVLHEFGLRRKIPERFKKSWRKYQRWLNFAAMLIVLGAYAAIIGFAIYLMKRFFHTIHRGNWSFGQIVAIFVWIPVIADFIHDKFVEHCQEKQGKLDEKPMLPMHRSFSYDKSKRKSHKPPKSPRPDYPELGIPTRQKTIVCELEGSSPHPLYHDEAALIDEKYDGSYFNEMASGLTKPAGAQELHDRAYVNLPDDDTKETFEYPRISSQAMAETSWYRVDIHN